MSQRTLRVNPYIPDRAETLDIDDGTWSSNDKAKAVKLDGDQLTLCANGDEIFGFISGTEPYTSDGDRVASVTADVGAEVEASDAAGTLAVGDMVVAGTQTAIGTAVVSSNGTPVIVRPALLTDSTGATATTTISDVTGSFSQSVLNVNFATLAAAIETLVAARSGWRVMAVYGSGAGRRCLLQRV